MASVGIYGTSNQYTIDDEQVQSVQYIGFSGDQI